MFKFRELFCSRSYLNVGTQGRQSRHHAYPGHHLNQTKSMQKIPSTILEPIISSGCATKYNVKI